VCLALAFVRAQEPPLEEIRFEGSLPFAEAKARKSVGMDVGKPFDPAEAQAASARLMEALRNAYYPMARVKWKAGPREDGAGLALVFQVETGLRGRLGELRFTGNNALSHASLTDVVSLRPRTGTWDNVTGADILLLEHLARDQEALLRRYQDAGFMDAEIGDPELEWLGEAEGFRITWPILREGPRYRIRSVRRADGIAMPDGLSRSLGLGTGVYFSPATLRSAEASLVEMLQNQGYAFAKIETVSDWDPARADVKLVFHVDAGPLARLREIRLHGNTVTRDAVLVREIPMRPGLPFSADALRVAHAGLESSGLFSSVDLQYQSEAGSTDFDLEVTVKEKKTGRVEVGVTYGSVEGTALLLQVREHNLALGPPWRGDALQASAGATLGSEITRFDVGLRNPRLGDSFWGLGGRFFAEDNAYISDIYDQRSLGFHVAASHPLGWIHLLSVGTAWTNYDVYGWKTESVPPSVETDVNLTSPFVSWIAEKVDQDFRPTRGFRVTNTLGYGTEVLGGDTEVIQYDGRGALYFNPVGEQVLVLRAGAASVDPQGSTAEVPLPLRVWLGGANNLRGFAYRSVSPRNEEGTATGGESALWFGAEYILPLLPRLDASLYYETGDVSADAWTFQGDARASDWGLGLMIRAQNFPIRFDLAFPMEVPEGDTTNEKGDGRLSFSAGYIF
jgi:outer membrane protein insertion porin family